MVHLTAIRLREIAQRHKYRWYLTADNNCHVEHMVNGV